MRLRQLAGIVCTWMLVGCEGIAVGVGTCGTEAADASTGCTAVNPLAIVHLSVPFTEVPTVDPADLPIRWRLDSPCPNPCTTPIELIRAGGDHVWTIPRDGTLPALRLVDADAGVANVSLGPAPDNSAGLKNFYVSSDISGAAYAHAQWAALGTKTGPESVFEVMNAPPSMPASVLSALRLKQGRVPWPLGVIPVSQGFLLFDGKTGSGTVELMDPVGQPALQNPTYPIYTQDVGTSAVQTSAGFVFGAGQSDPINSVYGLLSVDAELRYQQFAVVQDSTWRSVEVQPYARGQYAVAAASDLVLAGSLPGAGDGNIDVVTFPALDAPVGYRVKRSCFNKMTLNGFASDSAGNLYVSSVAGTEQQPRGLLCRMPAPVHAAPMVQTAGCFQTEPNLLIGDIVAAEVGILYAVVGPHDPGGSHANDQIVRVELPDW